jgi:hypothetical protein
MIPERDARSCNVLSPVCDIYFKLSYLQLIHQKRLVPSQSLTRQGAFNRVALRAVHIITGIL